MMNSLLQDIRHAARSLFRSPGFTAVAVLCLAVGIGATTSAFGAVNSLILRPPVGVREPSRVYRLYVVRRGGNLRVRLGGGWSYPDYTDLRAGARSAFSGIAAYFDMYVDVGRGATAERANGVLASGSYFSTLGVAPAVGRFFSGAEDSVPGSPALAVLAYEFWQRRFGGDRRVIGKSLVVAGRPVQVIGVAPPHFVGVSHERVDIWLPLMMASSLGVDMLSIRFASWLRMVGRLRPATGPERAANAGMVVLSHAAEGVDGLDKHPVVRLVPLSGAVDPALKGAPEVALLLLGGTGVLLIVACANVATLMLARAARRRAEVSVHIALGIMPGRLIRQLLTESAIIAIAGAGLGAILAVALHPQSLFPVPANGPWLDGRVLAFGVVVTTVTVVACGLAPALEVARSAPAAVLRDIAMGPTLARLRGGERVLAMQVALSLVLLALAGVVIQSLRRISAADLGFDVDRLLLVTVNLHEAGYGATDRNEFYARALQRIRGLPGVERVSAAEFPPFGYALGFDGTVPGLAGQPTPPLGPYVNYVGPGYFAAVGTSVLTGREFTDEDRSGSPAVALVNRTMANLYWPGTNPVGRCIVVGGQSSAHACTRVVGVVATAKYMSMWEPPIPGVYLPLAQFGVAADRVLLVRTSRERGATSGEVRRALAGLSAALPFVDVQPVNHLVELVVPALVSYRVSVRILSFLAAISLTLAAIGLYALTSYMVAQRRREIGVRAALGARPRDVTTLMLRRGLRPLAFGVVVGVAGAAGATHLAARWLDHMRPTDPAAFAGAVALLVVVAMLALYLPTRRASRVDPVLAMRVQ